MDFRAEIRIFGPKKKRSLLNQNHVLATTWQSCTKKKVPFSQINISLLAVFGCFFWKKMDFRPKNCFSAKRKNSRFSVIPAVTVSVVNMSHFFGGPDGPIKFCWPWSKIKGTYNTDWALAKNGQNPTWSPTNGPPSSQTATYQKTEVIQIYLRIWGTYYPIELGSSEPKKCWGFIGVV